MSCRDHGTKTTRTRLIDPPVIEGDCPNRRCGEIALVLIDARQLPEHATPGSAGRRCPCSGWLAINPRIRRHFAVEGVRYL
jgi:hypothetical protein